MMHSPFRHIPSIIAKRRPIHLTFFVTRRCNSRCPFCFYLQTAQERPAAEELSLAEIEKISTSFGSLLWLAFSGGEIFLRDDLPEISRLFYRQNRPAIMLFPTNGLLPELISGRMEEILRSCPESIVTVKLSLDGIGEEHDRMRNTPGAFRKTMETLERLRPLLERFPNFELGVNTVFCSENQDRMDSIIDFIGELDGIRTHTISLVRGNLGNARFTRVDMRKYRTAVDRLARNLRSDSGQTYRFRGGRLKAAQDILQRDLIFRTIDQDKAQVPCFAGRLNLVLAEDGAVFPCESLSTPMGNVRDHAYDIRLLCASEAGREIRDRIQRDACRCTHECYMMTNILFNPRCYPALAREYLKIGRG